MEISNKEIPIITGDECSVANFRSRSQKRHMPIVLRGVSIGSCVELWKSPEYLLSKTPNKQVKIQPKVPEYKK